MGMFYEYYDDLGIEPPMTPEEAAAIEEAWFRVQKFKERQRQRFLRRHGVPPKDGTCNLSGAVDGGEDRIQD